jgi:hypothetical protein
MPEPHAPINIIPTRAEIPAIPPVATPVMPPARDLTVSPTAKPTPMLLGEPIAFGPFNAATGGVVVGPVPPSEPSPAVRPLGFDKR